MSEFVVDGKHLMFQIARTHGNANCPIAMSARDLDLQKYDALAESVGLFMPFQDDPHKAAGRQWAYDVKMTEERSSYAVRCVGYQMRVDNDSKGHAQFARLVQCMGCPLHTGVADHTEHLMTHDTKRFDKTLLISLDHPWKLYRGGRGIPITNTHPAQQMAAMSELQRFHRGKLIIQPQHIQSLLTTYLNEFMQASYATTVSLILKAEKNPLSVKGRMEIIKSMQARVANTIKILLQLNTDQLPMAFSHRQVQQNMDWELFQGFLQRQCSIDKAVIFGWPPNHWHPDSKDGARHIMPLNANVVEEKIAFYRATL